MASKMITSHTTRSIEDHLNGFAGRIGMEGYDDTKHIHIAEENRDFVWPDVMWWSLIISILTGFPLPLMVICNNQIMDGGNRSTVLMLWRQNKFTVKIGDWEGNYDAMCANQVLAARWNRCMIPLTIITGASKEEKSQIFENYNKGINLTTGQLLKNRDYRPLVQSALSLIKRNKVQFPLSDKIDKVWRCKWNKTKSLSEISFAYQIIVGSMFGPDHYHTKFHLHLEKLMTIEQESIDLSNLQFICEVIDIADRDNRIKPKKRAMVFKKFIGAMIYDIHNVDMSRADFQTKWTTFCVRAYTSMTDDQMKSIVDVKTARATNFSRVRELSKNVSAYNLGCIAKDTYDSDSDNSSDSDNDSDE
jgi:hypothetical protein